MVPVPVPLDGRAHLEGHSQLDESDGHLVPHSDVGSAVCDSNLLWESVPLVTQVSGDSLGG